MHIASSRNTGTSAIYKEIYLLRTVRLLPDTYRDGCKGADSNSLFWADQSDGLIPGWISLSHDLHQNYDSKAVLPSPSPLSPIFSL